VYFHGVAQGLDLPAALALFGWLGAIAAWTLIQSKDPENGGLAGPVILAALGVGLIALVRLHDPWSARHPQATEVVYVADQTDASFWRVNLASSLDSWTRSALTGDGGALVQRRFSPIGGDAVLAAAKAQPVAVTPPT